LTLEDALSLLRKWRSRSTEPIILGPPERNSPNISSKLCAYSSTSLPEQPRVETEMLSSFIHALAEKASTWQFRNVFTFPSSYNAGLWLSLRHYKSEMIHSRPKWTSLEGREITGWPVTTIAYWHALRTLLDGYLSSTSESRGTEMFLEGEKMRPLGFHVY